VPSHSNRLPWLAHAELSALFFVQGAAMAMWFVPLTNVLDAYGLQAIKPYAFATTAVAAFISPLFFGAMADRRTAPVVVLRGLAVATALAMSASSFAIQSGAGPWVVLALIQLQAFCAAPTWSLSSTIAFAGLRDGRTQFGSIRAFATFGWMAGCWFVSALNADASTRAGQGGAVACLVVAGITFLLPRREMPRSVAAFTLRQRFGLDALALLRNRDHRVVFITAALFNIPLAAFYPYTPPHLRELGLSHTASWMSLGQVTEIIAMLALARLLLGWRLKWIIATGLLLGVVRFALCALDGRAAVLLGISLHGVSFTFVLITAQIYLNERIDPAWRARAQALLALMTGGFGNLIGYLGTGGWFAFNLTADGPHWPRFWLGLSAAAGAVLVFFLAVYRGQGPGARRPSAPEPVS